MVVDGDGQYTLGLRLADNVIIEHLADFARSRDAILALDEGGLALLADDVHAHFDAFIADEPGRTGDKLADLMLALPAEGAEKRILCVAARLGHRFSPLSPLRPSLGVHT